MSRKLFIHIHGQVKNYVPKAKPHVPEVDIYTWMGWNAEKKKSYLFSKNLLNRFKRNGDYTEYLKNYEDENETTYNY